MALRILRSLTLGCFLGFALVAAAAPVDDLLAKARSYLGTESDLATIKSLTYRGSIEVSDHTGAVLADASGSFEMIVQQPLQQLVVRTNSKVRETVGLDDLTGWSQVESLAPAGKSQLRILSLEAIRELQATAFENLSFFRGIERRRGTVELRGEREENGQMISTVAFNYPHGITFIRQFEKNSGRLLVTVLPAGGELREEGETVVGGVRFPKRMVTTGKTRDGKPYTVAITVDEVKLNQIYPASTFAVPLPGVK